MKSYKLSFWTSHHQFYIADGLSPFKTDSVDFWTTQAFEDKLATEEGIIGVGTACYGDVKADFDILDREPVDIDFSDCDHVVEASLNIRSGTLQIFPCISNESILDLRLDPNVYRVRVYSFNLTSVIGDNGDDYYKILIWPADFDVRKVLKQ
ncbi:MAG: hypothetical protein NTW29_02015 [Bacteroidetes bacterium]|nr:hypothetical protein [Bacteroidota bacterium]